LYKANKEAYKEKDATKRATSASLTWTEKVAMQIAERLKPNKKQR
jgi:hypothetical protein